MNVYSAKLFVYTVFQIPQRFHAQLSLSTGDGKVGTIYLALTIGGVYFHFHHLSRIIFIAVYVAEFRTKPISVQDHHPHLRSFCNLLETILCKGLEGESYSEFI